MFYLLKDNRIIDSNDIRNENDVCVKENQYQKVYELYINCSSIKKQSDNVFDLIEVGDLVKDDNCLYEVSEISDGKYDNGRKSAISQPGMFKHWEWEIEAIYKPNEKGDYIKVWERK